MRAFSSFCVFLCVVAGAVQDEAPPRDLWLADLRQLASAVREKWSYYEDRTKRGDIDLDALLAQAVAEVESARDPQEFRAIVVRLVAGLHDGHASVRPYVGWESMYRLPFDVVAAREGILVSRVQPEAAGREDGPRVGERWITVGGRTVDDVVLEQERLRFGSTEAHRRARALEYALRSDTDEFECAFEDEAGARRTVRLPGAPVTGTTRTSAESWTLRWPREDVALLCIASFAADDWQAWLAADVAEREGLIAHTKERVNALFAEIVARSPRALILDVRDNGGGTDLLGIHVAEHLIEGPFSYFLLSAQLDGRWTKPAGLTYGVPPKEGRYRGPLLALVDSGCFSTTDNFLRCLDDLHPDFTTIGRPTAGGTGAPRDIVHLEHSEIDVTLCTQRVYGPKGELIEGRGTIPDVPVEWSRADVVAGTDPDLAAALARVDALPRTR